MSAGNQGPTAGTGPQVTTNSASIIEVAARRGQLAAFRENAAENGWRLPQLGHAVEIGGRFALSTRPGRWHLIDLNGAPVIDLDANLGTRVDVSCAYTLFVGKGPSLRDVLARGCRVDLDPDEFGYGRAAATLIAQVAVTLVALSSDMLLITPSSTARHFAEWLIHTGAPFGLEFSPGDPR